MKPTTDSIIDDLLSVDWDHDKGPDYALAAANRLRQLAAHVERLRTGYGSLALAESEAVRAHAKRLLEITPAQSLAAVKSYAIAEAVHYCSVATDDGYFEIDRDDLIDYAYKIRESKAESGRG